MEDMPKIGIMQNNMPELPEVETVKNTILPLIKDKTIKKVTVFYNRLIQSDLETFKKEIINKKILNVQRYGKYLFFDLSDDYILIIHLRMEGKFSYNKNPSNARISSTTLIFNLDDNSTLSFNDTRKFGLMYLTTKKEIHSLPMMQKLGIEANKVEISDYPSLIKKLKRRKPIKELLLDQSILCGIGNIYADETLYRSKINPLTKGNELKDEQFIEIFKKELGYFKEKKYRNLANEIIYFYEEAKEINLSSFISFISTKDYIYDDAMEIIRKNKIIDFDRTAFDEFIQVAKMEMVKEEIRELKAKIANSMDANEEIELASKLLNLKKGCVGNEK